MVTGYTVKSNTKTRQENKRNGSSLPQPSSIARFGNKINDLNFRIGEGIDDAYDNVIRKLYRNDPERMIQLQSTFDGEDLAVIPDIIGDAALFGVGSVVGTPALGAALVAGKNGLQNAENIEEAIKGIDYETGDTLSDGEQWAKGLGAVGNVAISAAPVPSLGKIASKATKAFGKGAAKTAEEAGRVFKSSETGALKDAADELIAPPGVSQQEFNNNFVSNAAALSRSIGSRSVANRGQGTVKISLKK